MEHDMPIERRGVPIHVVMRVKLKNSILRGNKPGTRGPTLYGSIYIKDSKLANPPRQKADWWLPRAQGKRTMRVTA